MKEITKIILFVGSITSIIPLGLMENTLGLLITIFLFLVNILLCEEYLEKEEKLTNEN